MATPKTGILSKLYYNTGNFASPSWSEISEVRDLSQNAAWDTADVLTRASRVKGVVKTQIDLGFTASMLKKASTATNAVVDAFLAPNTSIDVMVLDGTSSTNGSRGFRYEALVTQANENQDIGTALYLDLAFSPDGFADNQKQSVLVTSGSPAFTNL